MVLRMRLLTRLNDRYLQSNLFEKQAGRKTASYEKQTEHYLEMDAGWEKIRVQFDMNPFQAY